MTGIGTILASARSDAADRFVSAEEPLAGLQLRCGGELPGKIAIPALLELVGKARRLDLRLARAIHAQDGDERVTAWVEVSPDHEQDGGCTICVVNWKSVAMPPEDLAENAQRRGFIDRHLAELSARLDPQQRILAVMGDAPDLADLVGRMTDAVGRPWTDLIEIPGSSHRQPLHWRLLDGATVALPGSERNWKVSLIPLGAPEVGSAGFELHLLADQPPPLAAAVAIGAQQASYLEKMAIGREVAPILRQPIARIIANAETIRTRMAGPLAEDYSNYAADIATAGEHLLALIDDLADLEVVEAATFSTAPDRIELGDVARRAAGILGVRAQEKDMVIDTPSEEAQVPAIGEFRRVLQVMINLVGNAIRYAPNGSRITISVTGQDGRSRISVADEGPGLSEEQQGVIFEKFERLGRTGDGGSGLGLYISRRLALAMGGELSVASTPGAGACFTLELPTTV